jgi:hypothetical protein
MKPLTLLFRNNTLLLLHTCRRQPILLRQYVNWTPDKSNPSNKKAVPGNPSRPPNGDPQSPAELEKAFQPPPPQEAKPTDSEPQLLRLKSNKPFNEWEAEWSERVWRAGQLTLIIGVLMAAYAVASGYVLLPYGMNYRASRLPLEGSDEEKEHLKQIETALHTLPIVKQLSADKEWIKTIGIFRISKEDAIHNLTMGTLAGTGRISVKPVTFWNEKTKEFVVVMHVGQDICGHRGLVHGGFLATVLDECLGKTVCVGFCVG